MANVSHILFVPMLVWGHTKPACHLALRLLECNEGITITFITAPYLLPKLKSEIEAHLPVGTLDNNLRIRALTAYDSSEKDIFKSVGPFIGSYSAAYQALYEEKPITCATTRVTYNAVPAPAAVIIDYFASPMIHMTRALSGKSVPVFIWATGSPYSMTRVWGPESFGGRANLYTKAIEDSRSTGEDLDALGNKYYKQTTGALVKIPGLPPMFDHEFFPQEWPAELFGLLNIAFDGIHSCDGVLSSGAYVLDSEGIEGVKAWMSGDQQTVYSVGPLLPRSYWDPAQRSGGSPDIEIFLENALKNHGENSVVLVSFGTIYWPPKAEYIEELFTALIDKEVPFILAQASPFAIISNELSAKIESSGLGIRSNWIPQEYVLAHPAIGWFLTHSGQGSAMEALGSGVPLICWPIEADQPAMTANLSLNLHVAFELLEVRTGPGLEGIYRLDGKKPWGTREAVGREIRDVIDATRGEVGREIRKNAQSIKARLRDSWKEDGAAMKDLRAFADKVLNIKGSA